MSLITNVKISIKIKSVSLDIVLQSVRAKNINHTKFDNFIVIREKFTYIIFKKGKANFNHVNVTKLSKISHVEEAVSNLINIFDCEIINHKIDNIIATFNLGKSLKLREIINGKVFESAKYNNERFPGLFVKFPEGTVILFHSGKTVLVGCKSEAGIQCLVQKICASI